MDKIFGVPMTAIMIVLLIMLGICLLTVAWIAWRRRVVFKLGVRNIPRRPAQTVLIVIGLMLSTLIIAAALGTGDTIDHSATAATYKSLGQADELVVYSRDEDGEGNINTAIDSLLPQSLVDTIATEFQGSELVDGIMPFLIQTVPAIRMENGQPGLSEPSVFFVGIDPAKIPDFGGLKDDKGKNIDLANLADNEVVISKDLADKLDAKAGDTIDTFYNNTPIELTVAAVAEDSPLSGRFDQDTPGMVVQLDRLQNYTGKQGQITAVAVSNKGGIVSGMDQTDVVSDRLINLFKDQPYGVDKIKKNSIHFAELFANIFTTFFLVFGLFSIAVGILLIILIFTMLAAERRSEMGMTRAIGAQRRLLMQQFVAEGTMYALAAGVVGVAMGSLAAIGIGYAVRPLLGDFLTIEPSISLRSIVVAYCLGAVITFIAVVIASWRNSSLNIVAAIRDITEVSTAGRDRRVFRRGKVKSAIAILVFGILVIAGGVAMQSAGSSAKDASHGEKALVILGGVVSGLGGLFLIWGFHRLLRLFWGVFLTLAGIGMAIGGQASNSAFLFFGGMSLLGFGIALLLRFFGVPSRPLFTVVGIYLVAFWLTPPGLADRLYGKLDGGIEMFFLSGIFMVAGATIAIVQNLDWLLGLVSAFGDIFKSKLPAVRTAVAFPGAAKGRTGMTIAMFSLIIFSLVVFATINRNFTNLFTSDAANAGWDIRADSAGVNPLGDVNQFKATLEQNGVDTSDISAIGEVEATFQTNMRRSDSQKWKFFPVIGMDDSFIANSKVSFQQRATGLNSDEDVINALRTEPDTVVVSSNALYTSGSFGTDPSQFTLADPDGAGPEVALTSEMKTFDPITVQVQASDGSTKQVRVIGVIESKISTLLGMYGQQGLVSQIYPDPNVVSYVIRLSDPENSKAKADQIEKSLIVYGVQGNSIKDELEDAQKQSTGFLYIFQGFMGLGLVVGIAAVGVIAFRSVVERRQQIGVLRAIGYQRSLVSLSFMIETLFVVGIGVISGTALGVALSWELFQSDDFSGTDHVDFSVPWLLIVVILIITIIAALLMTLVPARQAARLAPAEALRYE